jgi:AcrR family transcriptional regulator
VARRRLTRTQRQVQTKRDLVAAARRVFGRRGFYGATLEEISLEAGYTTGAIYSNFAGKDELFLAVLDERTERRVAAFGTEPLKAKSFEAALRVAVRISREGHEPDWAPLLVEFWTHASRDEELRRAVLDRHEQQLHAFAELVEQIGAKFGVTFRREPFEMARGYGALGRGLSLEKLLDPEAPIESLYEELFVTGALGMSERATH